MIRVVVERHIKEGQEAEVLKLIREIRGGALGQPGYISGETLVGYEDHSLCMVISNWESVEHWKAWEDSTQRKALDDKVEPLLVDEPRITLLKYAEPPYTKGYYRTFR